ncbi:hypothetical protein D9757_003785 [Collybiopsis confluens]|uniref:RING-type domain-containing protein n=1 Tax=Collybiopsis confluens TaxID=2823264 RepID=A0A8H5HV41_9AGAR|nr:hypothetical protein D9757_003785 [Collybiopsis confluens]
MSHFPLRRPTRIASLSARSLTLSTILEDLDQYDFPGLNLGTESLAATPKSNSGFTSGTLSRSRSRLGSLEARQLKQVSRTSTKVDRNCMICFDIALRPSRTRCCGKLFCETHINDWLAESSNHCPWCSTYCHPDTGLISLAPPVSPTAHSTGLVQPERDEYSSKRTDSQIRSRSSSSSSSSSTSSSSNVSTDPNLEQDETPTADINTLGFSSYLSSLIRHVLDGPPYETPHPLPLPSESPMLLSSPPGLSLETQISLTISDPSSSSEMVDVYELTIVALVSKVIGKVLTLVALVLVFWVLTR